MIELLFIVLGGAGIVWMVKVNARRNTETFKQYVLTKRRELEEAGDAIDAWAIGFVLEISNVDLDHTLDLNHVAQLAKYVELFSKESSASRTKQIENLDKLLRRIESGSVVNETLEREVIDEFDAKFEKWASAIRPVLQTLIPLFPEFETDDDDNSTGDVYTQRTNLLGRSSSPHDTIYQLTKHMCRLRGTGVSSMDVLSKVDRHTQSPEKVVQKFLSGTHVEMWLLNIDVETKVHIPFAARFEHTHILGGTGHGKTQFLQSLILKDVQKAIENKGSIVVIDGQGDLIRKITNLVYFDPSSVMSLADKLVLIDPTDVEYPCCLNMFDFDHERLQSYSPADRERIFNATIDLYDYFFGALLGAELTQKQNVIFKYLSRLMFAIPDATIHTLLDVMENGEAFQPYIDTLDGTSQRFFRTQFFNKGFADTKEQIARRLWGVLSNGTMERMFNNKRNKVDMFEAINDGKIVLINTSKDLLQSDGSAILGRFFIALLVQAALQRQTIPEHARRATFAYIDECHDYIDDKVEELLNQARKYKVGMVLAHQNLDQLSIEQRSTFAASTSIKFAGGLSAKDARTLAPDMRTSDDFLLSMKKKNDHTNFAAFVKNRTPTAIEVAVPFGVMEEVDTLSPEAYSELIAMNRQRYCSTASDAPGHAEADTATKQPSAKGTGGFVLGEPDVI